jgi:hypothetical protein
MERVGLIGRFTALDDPTKYEVMASFFVRNQPPTNDMFDRAPASLRASRSISARPGRRCARNAPIACEVETPKGSIDFDFLICRPG